MSLRPRSFSTAVLALIIPTASVFVAATGANAQIPAGSALPATAPTQASAFPATSTVAPLAAVATPADRAGSRRHRAQVNCTGGELEIKADNSSLNGILRAVSRCTGMKITGGVLDQRVFGNYGPAMPSAVLATLLDGTDTNVLLRETAADQPAELILTPRTEGPTPPSPSAVADDDAEEDGPPSAQPGSNPGGLSTRGTPSAAFNAGPASGASVPGSIQPGVQPGTATGPGVVSGPVSIPPPINNVNGSPSNTSPTAASYPTTHSVPLDSLPTPSTTPSQTGIVDAPNPPPAGSDTAALLNGRTTNMPGNTVIISPPTQPATAPGATNTTLPTPEPAAANGTPTDTGNAPGSAAPAGSLTPQQVFEQLQRLRQQTPTASQTTSQPTSQPQVQTQPAQPQ